MHLFRSFRRWFRGREIEPAARVAAEAEAKRLAYDRDSIRLSQDAGVLNGGSGWLTPTPDILRPHRDER